MCYICAFSFKPNLNYFWRSPKIIMTEQSSVLFGHDDFRFRAENHFEGGFNSLGFKHFNIEFIYDG